MNKMQLENLGSIIGVVIFLILGLIVGVLLKELLETILFVSLVCLLAYSIVTQIQIKKYGKEYNIKEAMKK